MAEFTVIKDLDDTDYRFRESTALFAVEKKLITDEHRLEFLQSRHQYLDTYISWSKKYFREFLRDFSHSPLFYEGEMHDGAVEFNEEVYGLGGKVLYLTQRGYPDNPNAIYVDNDNKTRGWLDSSKLKHDGVFYVWEKSDFIKKLINDGDNVIMFIEDSYSHLESVLELCSNVACTLLERPYNSNYYNNDMYFVRDLNHAKGLLKEIIVE